MLRQRKLIWTRLKLKFITPMTSALKVWTRVDWAMRDHKCLSALKALEPTLCFEDLERLKPMVLLRKSTALSFSQRLNRLPKLQILATEILEKAKARRFA